MMDVRAKIAHLRLAFAQIDIFRNPSFRPFILISTVLLSIFFTGLVEAVFLSDFMKNFKLLILKSSFLGDIFFPPKQPDWKDKLTALLPIVGLPVAFWLWFWRDQNTQNSLESTRKDVNLKEFQQVFDLAAGLFDADSDTNSRSSAQIAALHHLRAFLRGEYGPSFRRPAFELLLAGHAQAIIRTGLVTALEEWEAEKDILRKKSLKELIKNSRERLTSVDIARMTIIREEHKCIFESGFPLTNRMFDFIDFGWGSDFHQIKIPNFTIFRGSTFVGAHFGGVDAQDCDFEGCDFSGANLGYSDLRGSRFWDAKLSQADLTRADIRGANFATTSPYSLKSCLEASIDESTWLAPSWGHIPAEQRTKKLYLWLNEGADWDGRVIEEPSNGSGQASNRAP